MGNEASLREALARYEEKVPLSKEIFVDLPLKDQEEAAMLFLITLVYQRFILLQLIKRFEKQVYRDKCSALEKKINGITFRLKEDPNINPDPDTLEDFEDIRIDLYEGQSVTTVSKSKAERKKVYEKITKAINNAIAHIESEELQAHLNEHTDIGDPCCYRPGALRIAWTTEAPK